MHHTMGIRGAEVGISIKLRTAWVLWRWSACRVQGMASFESALHMCTEVLLYWLLLGRLECSWLVLEDLHRCHAAACPQHCQDYELCHTHCANQLPLDGCFCSTGTYPHC